MNRRRVDGMADGELRAEMTDLVEAHRRIRHSMFLNTRRRDIERRIKAIADELLDRRKRETRDG